MSGTNINVILSIYKSRNTILKHMNRIKYNVVDYEEFSINEIDVMFANSQLDMLLNHVENKTKVYIKYYFWLKQTTKQIRPQNLDNIIDDLYHIDEVLSVNDTLIVIIDEEPNDTILNYIKYLYEKDGLFIVIHNIKRLQFDILTHELVPVVKILSTDDSKKLMDKLNIKTLSQMPEISRFDPVSLAILLRPSQIVCFERKSSTAISTKYYRVCV
jgi:DNA-directed RNA polymerase subunit H (RpoH/RPB5)